MNPPTKNPPIGRVFLILFSLPLIPPRRYHRQRVGVVGGGSLEAGDPGDFLQGEDVTVGDSRSRGDGLEGAGIGLEREQ